MIIAIISSIFQFLQKIKKLNNYNNYNVEKYIFNLILLLQFYFEVPLLKT